MQEAPANPETEWHREKLTKDRRSQRRTGVTLGIIGICLLPTGAASVTWMYPRMVGTSSLFNLIGLFVTFLGTPLAFGLLGWLQYQEGRQPVSLADIERRRQHERSELFRMAQGKVPWRFSKPMLVILTIIGLLFLIPGVLTLLEPQGSGAIIWGILYSTCGILLLLVTLVILPRRIKRMPLESAQALGTSFIAGEVTPGENPSQSSSMDE